MTKKVLITGVAGGIGIETAKLFHAKGWEVIGTDIKEMEDALPINFIQGDISDKANNKIIFNLDKFDDSYLKNDYDDFLTFIKEDGSYSIISNNYEKINQYCGWSNRISAIPI